VGQGGHRPLGHCRKRNRAFGKGPPCSLHLRTCRTGGIDCLFKWTADAVHRTLIRVSPVLCSG